MTNRYDSQNIEMEQNVFYFILFLSIYHHLLSLSLWARGKVSFIYAAKVTSPF